MKIVVQIKCECDNIAYIPLTNSKYIAEDELDLSESIEQDSNALFYCSQNHPDGMDIICTLCGNDVKMKY